MPNEVKPFRVRVTVEIIDEDGNPVDIYGRIPRALREPWHTETVVAAEDNIDQALVKANTCWRVWDNMVQLFGH